MKVTVYKIKYDTDGARVKLPKKLEIEIPTELTDHNEMLDYVSNIISDTTGFCHKGFAIKPMTKKEFIELANDQLYICRSNQHDNVRAIFYEWKEGTQDGKYFGGFKYCFFGRACIVSKKEMLNTMYAYVTGKIDDQTMPYYINMKIAQTDVQRFKVPLSWTSKFQNPTL